MYAKQTPSHCSSSFISSFFFYSVESFVNSNTQDSMIMMSEAGPIDGVHIRYDHSADHRDRIGNQGDTMININELSIFDKNNKTY